MPTFGAYSTYAGHFGPDSAKLGPKSAKIGPEAANFDQHLPSIGLNLAGIGKSWLPNTLRRRCGQVAPGAETRREFDLMLADVGRIWPTFNKS